jgi:tetratricopeptide (TPR) repeat protein
LAYLAQVRGRLGEAEGHWRDAMLIEERAERPHVYLSHAVRLARLNALLRDDPEAANYILDAALARHPLDSIPTLNRPYLELAEYYAVAGQPERARATIAEYQAAVAPESRKAEEPHLNGVDGLVQLAEGRPQEAFELLRRWDRTLGLPRNSMLHLGRAYDLAGEADSAIALYERYVDAPDIYRVALDADYLALAYWRLGNLYEDQGDTERAVLYYGRLIELWEGADPELQPRVEAARRSIRALSPDR